MKKYDYPRLSENINLKPFLSLLFFNMVISVTVQDFNMKFSMHVLEVLLEGRVSEIFDLGLSFYFMSKNGLLFVFFLTYFSRLHKIQTRT